MKKIIFLLSLSCVVQIPHVSADTVQFVGEVSTQTCVVTINGQKNPIVVLPTVSILDLNALNKTAGDTPVSIEVTGCQDSTEGTGLTVEFLAQDKTDGGNLANILGPNKGIAIQLVKAKGPPFSFSDGKAQIDMNIVSGQTQASRVISARYIAEKTGAEAGNVKASVQFAISYK